MPPRLSTSASVSSSRSSSLSLPCVRGSRRSSSHDYLLDLVEKEEPRGKIMRLGSGSSDAGRGRAQRLLQVVGAVVGVSWGAALASTDGERVCCQPAKMSHMATLEVMSSRDRRTLCHPVRPAHGRRQGQVHRVVSKKHKARASNGVTRHNCCFPMSSLS